MAKEQQKPEGSSEAWVLVWKEGDEGGTIQDLRWVVYAVVRVGSTVRLRWDGEKKIMYAEALVLRAD